MCCEHLFGPGRVSGVDLFDRGQVYFGGPGKAVECRTFF